MSFDPYYHSFHNRSQGHGFFHTILNYLKQPQWPNRVVLLMTISYALFLLAWFYMYLFAVPLKFGETDFRFFVKYVALPGSLQLLLDKPWTLLTHFLIQTDFFQFLFHALAFAVFGKLFFDFWGKARFVLILLGAALFGALAFVSSANIVPEWSVAASSALLSGTGVMVFALMAYVFVYMPNHTFVYMMIIRLKLKYIILIFVALELLAIDNPYPGVYLAYLASISYGALFAIAAKRLAVKAATVNRIKTKRKRSEPFFDFDHVSASTLSDEEYNMMKKQKQERIDEILDKISKYGYGSLTKEEKDFLFYESKK